METLQLTQVLADLSNLGAAEPEAAATIVNANRPSTSYARSQHDSIPAEAPTSAPNQQQQQQQGRPSALKRAWSSEPPSQPMVDRFGRRILSSAASPRSGSTTNSTPGTPRGDRGTFDLDGDLERASTLMALYDIRAKIKQQDNSSLLRAREKINALAAKQQAQLAAERDSKAADEARRNRYSFPKPGL
jgi:hypothetical protein